MPTQGLTVFLRRQTRPKLIPVFYLSRILPLRSVPVAVAVFVLGLCFSAGAGLWLRHDGDAGAQAQFQRMAQRAAEEITRRYRQPVYGLNGARGLYAANERVSRAQFRAYVESRDLPREFPGFRGFGFIQRVKRADLDALVAAERADGAPDFAARSLGDQDHDDLLVVKYYEPRGPNSPVLGLDVGSEVRRREAAQGAIDTGQPTLSAAITLAPGDASNSGALLYVPVFANGSPVSTVAQRRASLLGLLFAPIATAELLDGMSEVASGIEDFKLFDAASGTPVDAMIYDAGRNAGLQAGRLAVEPSPPANPRFLTLQALPLPGRDLTLRVASTPRFEASVASSLPCVVFAAGTLGSALLALLVWQQASGRQRAEARAQGMTTELERLAQVARYTSNAVLITDRATRITWINEGFTRISGYSLDDALGKTPGELLGSGMADPAVLQTLADGVTSATACRVQIINRAKDGHTYWIDTEIQPLRNAQGQVVGFMEIGSDITASKNSERELARERRALADVIEATDVGTWEWNIESGDIVLNQRWAGIFGDTLAELGPTTVQAWRRRTHPDDLVRSTAVLQRHFNNELPAYECEIRMRHQDGHWVWVLSRGKVLGRDDHGAPRWMAGTHMDIGERKRAEEALRALQQQQQRNNEIMRSVLDNLPCALSVYDADLRLVMSNVESRRLLGLPERFFTQPGTRLEDMIRYNAARGEYGTENVEAQVQAKMARARGAVVPHQFERIGSNGIAQEVRVAPMPGGGIISTQTDISLRRKAEAEVQRSTQLLHGAINALDDAFVLFNSQDQLVLCNQRYRDLYRLCVEVVVPGNSFEHIVRTAAMRGQFAAAVGRVDEWVVERMAAHRDPPPHLTQKLGDGHVLRIRERRTPDGHTVGFAVDITELVRATELAQEATRSKSQFLANMSHEIRTPMNAILGLLALLRKTDLTARQADYAGKTEGAARSLLGLLNDILDFSKVEAGKMTLDPHPFRIDRMLRDLSVILSANIDGKPVEVLFDIDPALPRGLVGDAMRLQQVLINLSGNAIKFTAEGEVVLSMVVVQRDATSVTVEIAVRDTGVGIAPENQARIFSAFTQAESSTTRRFGGTGLGLAISQRLVAMMGGELRLDSALGQGSRFHFRIALALAPAIADQAPSRVAPSGPLRALVVDDNPAAREVLERMGQSLGWTVDVAGSGEAALELLRTHATAGSGIDFDAVFVDWQMPGLDGWQTSQRIRDLGLASAPPVIAMVTAHGHELLTRRSGAEQALLDAFLVKPVTASMLFDAMVDARSGQTHPHPSRVGNRTAAQRLAGMRLLVAEDNLNNQQVARELLEYEGALVQIAHNGREAVDAVVAAEPRQFDVVLMDLQMPVMDGFTATNAIRQQLGLQALPIVAMTANAMASDREACLAAGMNDHVGKPFDLDHLVRVLRRQAGWPEEHPQASTGAGPVVAPPLRQAAAAANVDIGAALNRLGGKQDLYQRLLGGFLGELATLPARLQAHQTEGDTAGAARLLHTLKGLAATLGAMVLSDEAARGETRLAQGGRPEDLAEAIPRACAAISAAEPGLAALLKALHDAPGKAAHTTSPAPLDTLALRNALLALAEPLRNADMAATDALANLLGRFGANTGNRLQPLDEAIGALDFERALRLCDKLIHELGDFALHHPAKGQLG